MYRVAKKNRSLQSGSKRSLFIDQSLQKFVSIRSSLFLRHLQNIKFELAKLIAFQPLQSVLQMSSTALLADFNAAVEVLNDSLACITWNVNPPDFFLWGYLKDRVYADNPQTISDLKAAITAAIQAIPRDACERVIENFHRRV